MSQDILHIKRTYLFDEKTGLIRNGLPMSLYAKILYTEDEDELQELIESIIEQEQRDNDKKTKGKKK